MGPGTSQSLAVGPDQRSLCMALTSTGGLDWLRTEIGDADEAIRLHFDENDPRQPILCGGCFGIRRNRFPEIGGLDAAFGPTAEDNEFAWRWMARGEALPVSKSVRIPYRGGIKREDVLRKVRRAARGMALLALRYDRLDPWPQPRKAARDVRGDMHAVARETVQGDAQLRYAGLERIAAGAGALGGLCRYRLLRQMPAPGLKTGFDEGAAQREEEER